MKKTAQKSPRCDSWYADLDEVTRWKIYDKARRATWYVVADWAQKEFALKRAPGRRAVYAFKAFMRENESAHRVEETITAKREVGTLAQVAGIDNQDLISAYITMGADIAMRTGAADDAKKFTGMAMDLGAFQTKMFELELKKKAQQTKDEQLKLAREKFEAAEARLAAVKQTLNDATLTPEEREARYKEIFGL